MHIHIYIYNKLSDRNSKINFEVPKRDIHVFKIDNSNGILHQISRRVILEGPTFIFHIDKSIRESH